MLGVININSFVSLTYDNILSRYRFDIVLMCKKVLLDGSDASYIL